MEHIALNVTQTQCPRHQVRVTVIHVDQAHKLTPIALLAHCVVLESFLPTILSAKAVHWGRLLHLLERYIASSVRADTQQ